MTCPLNPRLVWERTTTHWIWPDGAVDEKARGITWRLLGHDATIRTHTTSKPPRWEARYGNGRERFTNLADARAWIYARLGG